MSHPINVSLSHQTIDVSSEGIALDRDIILDIDLPQSPCPVLVAAEQYDSDSKLAILTALSPGQSNFISLFDTQNPVITTTEFIFIVDCSGSMYDENRIGLAQDAMMLFVRSLPMGAHFNIIRFGSDFRVLFTDVLMTTVYDERTAKEAEDLARLMRADLGGTELLRPLQYLKDRPPVSGRSRQVFILTDGEIANTNEVNNTGRKYWPTRII
ncbi:unnamed protein product [Rotaria sp. Silwood2]|nr:unnamed protein product [Rotaria sp. Silwood2]CAF4624339.1 unnamed protein product [Rotaria sp. Silwood2]